MLVVLDAKRDEVYLQAFDASGRPQGEAEILPAEEARLRFSAFAGIACGSGAPAVTGAAGGKPDEIDMAALARLGAAADPVSARPKPLYLRGPDAKPQAGFAVTRA